MKASAPDVDLERAGGCPVCSGLDVVRYDPGQAPPTAPFCTACRRRLVAVEVGADERRRLAAQDEKLEQLRSEPGTRRGSQGLAVNAKAGDAGGRTS